MNEIKDKIRLQELAHKYLQGNLTREEKNEVDDWFNQTSDEPVEVPALFANDELAHKEAIFNKIKIELGPKRSGMLTLWRGIAAAVLLICTIGAGILYFKHDQSAVEKTVKIDKNDIPPGSSGATLTLANGKRILLSSVVNTGVLKAAGVEVQKNLKGELIYKQVAVGKSIELAYHTLTTAKGEQYQVILPDNSHVWLNSASSIKFPINFARSKERRVFITGQAYFEVAKDKTKPFKVVSDGQLVTVYGTHFDINGYKDEAGTRTTLLEGSVDVNGTLLKPKQQAINENGVLKVMPADVESIIAWKNGYFRFTGETLESVMRKVSRWYNVDVEFQSPSLKAIEFGGVMTKYVNVSKVLEKLELTGEVSFELKGRTIIIKNRK
ncbi:FecR family protein [Pedobacter nyackensis]|uniref:FecR family protein n=1 Tax=Pedobacter nyackensis TaxID=475255 RepID=A0A1W2EQ24_9SPHI|nr:FecR family protein [Pedobacter nyackensis]SMD11775.1 FecR family protein [Pedobacter nyackensis]